MQETSALYKQLLSDPNHWFECSLVIGESGLLLDNQGDYIVFGTGSNSVRLLIDDGGADGGFNESVLISLQTTNKLFADDVPQCGCAVASEIDVEMIAPLTDIPKKARVVPYVRLTDGRQYSEWIQKGVYYIDTREYSIGVGGQEVLKFHGYDCLVETDKDFPSTAQEINTDADCLRLIAETINVDIDERTWEIVNEDYQTGLPIGYSMREVLQQIASAYAGNFIINDVGELRLVRINEMPNETNLLVDNEGYTLVFGDESHIDIIFNQLVHNGNFINNTDYWKKNGSADIYIENGVCVVPIGDIYAGIKQESLGNVVGHKYFVRFDYKGETSVNMNYAGFNNTLASGLNANDWNRVYKLFESTGTYNGLILFHTNATNTQYYRNVIVMDITEMFGEGEEPETADEINEMFPDAYYDFDEGSHYEYLKGVRIIV